MHIHLASTSMSVKRTIFVRSNSKRSKYSAINIVDNLQASKRAL